MPSGYRFFSSRTKPETVLPYPAPAEILQRDCEMFFGIQTKSIQGINGSSASELLRIAGFSNIYGLSCLYGIEKDVRHASSFKELQQFVSKNTLEEKRELFLSHGESYIERFLLEKGHGRQQIEPYQEMIAYVSQRYKLASYPLLHDGIKHPVKKAQREERFSNLRKINGYVTQLLFVGMAIDTIISKKQVVTNERIGKILAFSDKFIVAKSKLPDSLQQEKRLEKDETIEKTMGVFGLLEKDNGTTVMVTTL